MWLHIMSVPLLFHFRPLHLVYKPLSSTSRRNGTLSRGRAGGNLTAWGCTSISTTRSSATTAARRRCANHPQGSKYTTQYGGHQPTGSGRRDRDPRYTVATNQGTLPSACEQRCAIRGSSYWCIGSLDIGMLLHTLACCVFSVSQCASPAESQCLPSRTMTKFPRTKRAIHH